MGKPAAVSGDFFYRVVSFGTVSAHEVHISGASSRIGRTCSLYDSASRLRYVSPKRFKALEHLGIHTVSDVLLHIPHRYLDFSAVKLIGFADVGSTVTVVARVDAVQHKRPRPRLDIVEVTVVDDTGLLKAVFFQQPWVAQQISVGDVVALSGKVSFAYGFKQMNTPFFELVQNWSSTASKARIVPVHPVSEQLSVAWMRRIVSCALADVADVCDFVPAHLISKRYLMTRGRALREIHFPSSLQAAEQARRRLAYDELILLQLALHTRRQLQLTGTVPVCHRIDGPYVQALYESLPYTLTDEQQMCVNEILSDMAAPHCMNRLLLGDVGTGKTVVAAFGLAACADSNKQAAMMAPTSVLASQYAAALGPLLDYAQVSWALLTGATPPKERETIACQLAEGTLSVVFGTTALLSDDIRFRHLSFVVVDEQHRFGVDQRTALRKKSAGSDMLSMTATPIPRTLALSLYGDLACSHIRRRPNKRAGVTTQVIPKESLDVAYGAIRTAVSSGQQAYVVCPLIDTADTGQDLDDDAPPPDEKASHIHAATEVYKELSSLIFPNMRIALLTGRMTSAAKDEVMQAYRTGSYDVLVATTVVEVGVDVPNASVMLVFDADRFGLATLHQIRGRVGRGEIEGKVFLHTSSRPNSPARKRLDAVSSTNDGEKLAELDLHLRHEGEVLGYRQHGEPVLKVVNLARDEDLVEAAHEDAQIIIQADPQLTSSAHLPLAYEVQERFSAYFQEVGRAGVGRA